MQKSIPKLSRLILTAGAAVALSCSSDVAQDSVPHTRAGDDGRRFFFSEHFIFVDVTADRRLLARVEPINPKNPVYEFPIFVHDLQKGTKKVVTERAYFPVFSPDGEWIAYQKLVGSGDLWLVKSDGSSDRPLVEFPGTETPTSWSADGNRILFHTSPAGDEIWYYDLEENAPYLVYDGGASFPSNSFSPVWAPLGEELYFCRENAKGATISRINRDGSGLVDIWPYDATLYAVDIKSALPYDDRLLLTVTETSEREGKIEIRTSAWFYNLKDNRFAQLTYNGNPPEIRDAAVRLCPDNVLIFRSKNWEEYKRSGVYVIKTP